MSQPDQLVYLTPEQIATVLDIPRRKVLDLAAEGRFPGAFKVGDGRKTSPWRIPPAGFAAYVKAQQEAALAALAAKGGSVEAPSPDGRVRRGGRRVA